VARAENYYLSLFLIDDRCELFIQISGGNTNVIFRLFVVNSQRFLSIKNRTFFKRWTIIYIQRKLRLKPLLKDGFIRSIVLIGNLNRYLYPDKLLFQMNRVALVIFLWLPMYDEIECKHVVNHPKNGALRVFEYLVEKTLMNNHWHLSNLTLK
jgi:hypothetical protein